GLPGPGPAPPGKPRGGPIRPGAHAPDRESTGAGAIRKDGTGPPPRDRGPGTGPRVPRRSLRALTGAGRHTDDYGLLPGPRALGGWLGAEGGIRSGSWRKPTT